MYNISKILKAKLNATPIMSKTRNQHHQNNDSLSKPIFFKSNFEHEDSVFSIVFHGDIIAAGGQDKKVIVRDLKKNGEILYEFEHEDSISSIALNGDIIAADFFCLPEHSRLVTKLAQLEAYVITRIPLILL